MSEKQGIRISKVVKEFNIGIGTLTDFLKKKGSRWTPLPTVRFQRKLMLL